MLYYFDWYVYNLTLRTYILILSGLLIIVIYLSFATAWNLLPILIVVGEIVTVSNNRSIANLIVNNAILAIFWGFLGLNFLAEGNVMILIISFFAVGMHGSRLQKLLPVFKQKFLHGWETKKVGECLWKT